MTETTPLDTLALAANTLRMLAAEAVEKANSGHPGMPMGMADVAATLWLEHLMVDPRDPQWIGRDRFVLSAGHGSMLLYSLLHLAGFELPITELQRFRQWESRTPGHPEFGHTAGVDTTTGPLGQGFATGVGMALAAKMLGARFDRALFEARVWAIVSDGDLMEGISAEAASLAGHLHLDNLIYLYDDNRITIEGKTELAFSEDVAARFRAVGWDVHAVDGHDLPAIRSVLAKVAGRRERPTLVICRTHIAQGAPNKHDSEHAHGAPLGAEELAATRKNLKWDLPPFAVPPAVRDAFAARAKVWQSWRTQWNDGFKTWSAKNPEASRQLEGMRKGTLPQDLLAQLCTSVGSTVDATRNLSSKVLQKAAELVPALVGGSADLSPSTKTNIGKSASIKPGEYGGRVLHFGIREHAMGAMTNGLVLYGGFRPFAATFLVFSDYMRPAIRLAALMGQPAIYVFTHDSLMLGEDGPTHQPIEHLGALRLIPNLFVVRPADAPETAAAWTLALQRQDGPTALILTRQKTALIPRPPGFDPATMLRGAYVAVEASGREPDVVLVATGAEVGTILEARTLLEQRGKAVRVVSAPCVEAFARLPAAEQQRVIPADGTPVVAVEMARGDLWHRWVGAQGLVLGIERFGASAPAELLAEKFGFTGAAVAERVLQLLG